MNSRSTPTRLQSTHRAGVRGNLLVAAALAAASLGAVAQTVAPLTRAEVTAELVRARANGEMDRHLLESLGLFWMQDQTRGANAAGVAAAPEGTGHKGLTRQEVKAELIRAREAGELDLGVIEVGIVQPATPSRSPAFASGIGRAEALHARTPSSAAPPLPQGEKGE